MKCSIGYSETKVMITYEDLQREAKDSAEKKFEYVERLRRYMGYFLEKYMQSLGISGNPTFVNWNGDEESIVTLGDVENGRFVRKGLHEFKVNDEFELLTIVKTVIKTDAMQSPWITVPVGIREKDGVVRLEVGDGDDSARCLIPAGNTLDVYSEAADLMKAIIIKMIRRTAPQ